MALFTLINRVPDGLPLVESTATFAANLHMQQQQAKGLMKKLVTEKEQKVSVDSGSHCNYCIIEGCVAYLVLTEKTYSHALAFKYLEEIKSKFISELSAEHGPDWQSAVQHANKAYAFLKFDRIVKRISREYYDPSSMSTASKIADEMANVQGIMRRNIQEVLNRGEKLNDISNKSARLVSESSKYKWGAKKLNTMDKFRQYAPYAVAVLFIIFVIYWWI